jgi:transcription antitermination factor NusG
METGLRQLPWFALQVRPRSEKGVATQLEGRGYDICLPAQPLRRQWSDRIKVIEMPLFPGYVFCRLDPSNRLPVLTTPGVVQIVGFGKGPVPVEESELAAVQAIVSSGMPVQPWPFLQCGDRVRINHGPLRDVEGILLELRGSYRVIVSMNLLQRSVSVEVDSAWVSPLVQSRARSMALSGLRLDPVRA